MKTFPSIPTISKAPDGLLRAGHLWLFEKVDGAAFRFQLRDSGLVRFGDRNRVYDDADDVPEAYQHAIRHVREHLDRDSLRAAVDDVEGVVFFGEAMHRHTIDYDWERTPSFLGFDVWFAQNRAFRPPDAVEQIFERLGLRPVNVFEREVHTRDFDPDSYTIPESNWYDGPAEGVVVRDKQGRRAKLLHPDSREIDEPIDIGASADELAAKFATRSRFQNLTRELEDQGTPVTVENLLDRVLEAVIREEHRQLSRGDRPGDMQTLRSEIAARTRAFLEGE